MANRNDERRSREIDREHFEKAFPPAASRRKPKVFVFSPDTADPAGAGRSQRSMEFAAWERSSSDDQENRSVITCHKFPNSLEGVVDKVMSQMESHERSASLSELYRRISALGIDVLRMREEVVQFRKTLVVARKELSADELGHISSPSGYVYVRRYWQGHRRHNIPVYDIYLEEAKRLAKDLGISWSMFAGIAMLAAVSRSRWAALTDAQEEANLELEEFFEVHVARVRRRYEESLSNRAR